MGVGALARVKAGVVCLSRLSPPPARWRRTPAVSASRRSGRRHPVQPHLRAALQTRDGDTNPAQRGPAPEPLADSAKAGGADGVTGRLRSRGRPRSGVGHRARSRRPGHRRRAVRRLRIRVACGRGVRPRLEVLPRPSLAAVARSSASPRFGSRAAAVQRRGRGPACGAAGPRTRRSVGRDQRGAQCGAAVDGDAAVHRDHVQPRACVEMDRVGSGQLAVAV